MIGLFLVGALLGVATGIPLGWWVAEWIRASAHAAVRAELETRGREPVGAEGDR